MVMQMQAIAFKNLPLIGIFYKSFFGVWVCEFDVFDENLIELRTFW
jgi:hypothetical protein